MPASTAEELRALDRGERQRIVIDWGRRAFGDAQMTSPQQRAVRLLEEAIEAYQACGAPRAMAHRLVDFVFDRPPGEIGQELGGVAVTLLALAGAAGLDADEQEVTEIARCLSKDPDHYAKRNAAKNAAGFDTLGEAPADRTFPVQREHKETPGEVPWAFIEPFRARALANHDQTLERLAARGGCSAAEIWAMAHDVSAFDKRIPTSTECEVWLARGGLQLAAIAVTSGYTVGPPL